MTVSTEVSDALTATCQTCKKVIADGDGYLWIDVSEAMAAAHAEKGWEARSRKVGSLVVLDHDQLMAMPEPAHWRVHHTGSPCDPDPDANAYPIELGRVETARDLLTWTAHLMEKNWMSSTDWLDLIRGAAQGTDGRLRVASEVRA